MEHTARSLVELVELVYRFATAHVPQDPVVENKIVVWAESRAITTVIIRLVLVIERHHRSPRLNVVNLQWKFEVIRFVQVADFVNQERLLFSVEAARVSKQADHNGGCHIGWFQYLPQGTVLRGLH